MKLPSPTNTDPKPINGLCLNFHHLNQDAVGSRRFRNLVTQFEPLGIHLDVLCQHIKGAKPGPGITTAGQLSPFSTLLRWSADVKRAALGMKPLPDKATMTAMAEAATSDATAGNPSLTSFLNSLDFLPDGDAGWILPATWAGMFKRKKYQFVISTAPPWSSHIAAIMIGKMLRLPVILDDRDPWAGSPGRLVYLTHPAVRRFDKFIAEHCYRQASGIVCVTEPACKWHRNQSYGQRFPIRCFSNGFDPGLAKYHQPPQRRDKINFTYVGSFYHGRSPMVLLGPAMLMPPEIAKDFHFHFVGNLSDGQKEALLKLERPFELTLHGPQSHEFCLRHIVESDVCILLAVGQPSQVPAKLYEYIGLQRPVLSISEKDDATMAQLAEFDWAWTSTIGDEAQLIEALQRIHQVWKAGGLPTVSPSVANRFSFSEIARDYVSFVQTIIGTPSGTATPEPLMNNAAI